MVFGGVPGSTDGTILTRDAGLDTVVYGPGGKWIAHQADEFVEVADILRCARVFAVAASRFLESVRPATRTGGLVDVAGSAGRPPDRRRRRAG